MHVLNGFRSHLVQAPDRVAVRDALGDTSYGALAARSDEISAFLLAQGVGPRDRVMLGHIPGAELIAAMIGILQVGAAYVPVDLQAPDRRNLLIARQADPCFALVPTPGIAGIDGICPVAAIDDIPAARLDRRALPPVEPRMVAYIIFTSGTTGVPKGVPITHGNLAALLRATEEAFRFGPEDRGVLYHSHAFDFSVWEIWSMLAYGGCLCIPGPGEKLGADFARYVADQRITVLNQTPTAFSVNGTEILALGRAALQLRCVVFGGERLTPAALRGWAGVIPLSEVALINMYGITETTVHSTLHRIRPDDLGRTASPIGTVLEGFTARLLPTDPHGPAAVGELLLAGPQVSRGYLGRPDLTEERFLEQDGMRFYRTGDLVERVPGGFLFRGRVDDQLAINGHRVETGEIESVLLANGPVRDLAVVVEETASGPLLVCFCREADPAARKALRRVAVAHLPVYMRPNKYIPVPGIARTANGKVDREALRRLLHAHSD